MPAGFYATPVNAERRRQNLTGYFAAVEGMGRNLGRLLDWLDARNLRSNTLVVFMSDNGMNMGHHGLYGKGNATWPQNMFDTSLISRPGYVPKSRVYTDHLSQYDWLPTLVEYLGAAADQTPDGLPGRSFAPLLAGRSIDEEEHLHLRRVRTGADDPFG